MNDLALNASAYEEWTEHCRRECWAVIDSVVRRVDRRMRRGGEAEGERQRGDEGVGKEENGDAVREVEMSREEGAQEGLTGRGEGPELRRASGAAFGSTALLAEAGAGRGPGEASAAGAGTGDAAMGQSGPQAPAPAMGPATAHVVGQVLSQALAHAAGQAGPLPASVAAAVMGPAAAQAQAAGARGVAGEADTDVGSALRALEEQHG